MRVTARPLPLVAALFHWWLLLGADAGEINLRASWVTDGDLLELARQPDLQKLDLSQTRISDQGLAYLKTATNLREVNLAYAEKIGDPAHAVIKHWKNLRKLNLRGTVIADETAASAATLPDLEVLDIADTIVGDFGVEALTTAPKLKELSMGNIRMSEVGFQSLRQFTTLSTLDLSGRRHQSPSNISERGIEAIASLRQLRVLKLGHTKFPAKSFALLAKMPQIEQLGLEFCPEIDDEALQHLAAWKSLRRVDLYGTNVTAAGVAALREQRPDCQVLWE
jgi:internalin A